MKHLEKYVKGDLSLGFPEIKSLADVFVVKYGLLKYPSYALEWDFKKYKYEMAINQSAFISLFVNNNYDKDSGILENYVSIDLDPLLYCALDQFSAPSKENCEWLQSIMSENDTWKYYITSWSIIGDYHLSNIYYASDHYALAKRIGRNLPDNPITLHIEYNKDEPIYFYFDKMPNIYDEYSLIETDTRFVNDLPSVDLACLLQTRYYEMDGRCNEKTYSELI